MRLKKNVFGQIDFGREVGRAAPVGMDLRHQSAVGRADGLGRRTRLKAKDLVSLVMAHGARIRRAGAPRTRSLVLVFAPTGKRAVKVRFQ